MKKTLLLACFALGISLHLAAHAATLIETEEPEAGILQLWVGDGVMRIDDNAGNGYSLMDAKRRKMFVVNPEERQVMDMSNSLQTLSTEDETPPSGLTLSSQGPGPTIAGYDTEHYVVSFEGRKCKEIFASVQALEDTDMGDLIALLGEFTAGIVDPMGEGRQDPCAYAESTLDYRKLGLPLRTLDSTGGQDYLVRRIELQVADPPGGFSLPNDYQVIDFAGMMQEMMQQMPQLQK